MIYLVFSDEPEISYPLTPRQVSLIRAFIEEVFMT